MTSVKRRKGLLFAVGIKNDLTMLDAKCEVCLDSARFMLGPAETDMAKVANMTQPFMITFAEQHKSCITKRKH